MYASGRLRGPTFAISGMLLLTAVTSACGAHGQRAEREKPRVAAAASFARVVAAGDIACKPGARVTRKSCRHAATAALAVRLRPQLVLPLGDTQYERGSLRQYRGSYARTWGKLLSRTRPTVGNHEYETPGARGYYTYFKHRQPNRSGYYRTAVNGWTIYYLNSNCSRVSCLTQARWLDRQMTARPASCTIVTMHHPRFSSGRHGNTPSVRPLWNVAFRHGTDIALSGHDHVYERFRPMDGAGRILPSRGMQGFVVGTGGKSLFPFGARKPGSVYRQNRSHGVLALDLGSGSWRWAFRTIDGRVLDRGARSCL